METQAPFDAELPPFDREVVLTRLICALAVDVGAAPGADRTTLERVARFMDGVAGLNPDDRHHWGTGAAILRHIAANWAPRPAATPFPPASVAPHARIAVACVPIDLTRLTNLWPDEEPAR